MAVAGGVSEETLYVAGLFERVTLSTGGVQFRHYIPGGDGVAAIHTRSGGSGTTYYVHSDHLGSPELFTNSAGAELVRLSFGAYGERRDGNDWSGPPPAGDLTTLAGITRRGFTGHEHLDAVGLIHMNGRVYDPVAGRFLGADPIVEVGNSQSPNSYSYVWNNPLSLIDPSGFEPGEATDTPVPTIPDCFIDLDRLGVDCNGIDVGNPWRWYIFDRQVDLTVLFRIRQAYLGNQWPERRSSDYNAALGQQMARFKQAAIDWWNTQDTVQVGGYYTYGKVGTPPSTTTMTRGTQVVLGTAVAVAVIAPAVVGNSLMAAGAAQPAIISIARANVSLAKSIEAGLVRPGGKLAQVLGNIERGVAAARPNTAMDAAAVVQRAATEAGLDVGIASINSAGQFVLRNVGGVITTIGTDGSIVVTRGTAVLLGSGL